MENMKIPEIHYFGAIMAPELAEMHSEPMPEALGPKDILVKMLICNICTNDYQTWQAKRTSKNRFPMASGHEWVGDVVAIGEDVKLFQIGDRVGQCSAGCGECIMCRMGHTEQCLMPKSKGGWKPVNGFYGLRCFSNYKVFKQNQLIKMNKDLPPQLTAFLEPVSTAVGGARKLNAPKGDTIVILGAGSMGIVNALVYHALGYRVIITELTEKKLARARSMGWAEVIDSKATDPVQAVKDLTDGVGADAVVPCVGLSSVYAQAQQMIKKHDGKILLFPAGYPEPTMDVDPNEVHYNRAEIIGTYGGEVEDIVLAAKLINSSAVDPSYAWEGETFPLYQIQDAYVRAATPDMYRISVDLQRVSEDCI